MESVGQWLCFLVVIIFQVVQTESCEFGTYISGLTNLETCCVNCRTWDRYNIYFESSCPDFPYVCKSDTGIFLEPYVEDELTGTTTSASMLCNNIIVDCDEGINSTSVAFNITTEGNIKDKSCTQITGTVMELGSHLITCRVTDAIKKTTLTCNFTVLVIDKENPKLECTNMTLTTIPGENYANVTYEPDVWDNSREMLKPNCSLEQGSRLSIGTHQVSCSVSDSSLNMNSCSGSVLVEDKEIPKIDCPNMNFTTIPGENYVNVTYEPIVWDNSGDTRKLNCSLAQGSRLLIGTHQVSCSVSDSSLNMNSCSGSVLVEDNEKPKLECPNMKFTTIPGEDYANVTYEPNVWDNSREMLKPNCSLAQGSRLSIGTHYVSCSVSDSSLNMNSCSGSVLVEEVSKVESKLSKPEIISITFALILAVLCFGFGCCIRYYCKRQNMMFAKNEVKYNPSNDQCVISMPRWLIVENHGASFVDIMLSQHVESYTKVDISWSGNKGRDTKTIKKEDFNKILTINDLPANHHNRFQLTGHSNFGNHVPVPEYLQTHKTLSEIFDGCELCDVTYDSMTVKHQCTTDNLTCKSVWLVIRERGNGQDDHCSDQDYHYSEKRIDNASLIHHTFEDLKPGHHYEVLVEVRTLNSLSTVKDSYNIGHIQTKAVSIKKQEIGCNKVTVLFSDLDDDYEPMAFICCGKTTTTEQGMVTIDNLQPDCDYILAYGVIHNGKQIQQGQLNIRTLSDETELSPDSKCEESITEVLSLQDFDNLITVMAAKGMLLLRRVAAAMGFDQPFEVLKNDAITCQYYKSTLQGLIANRRTCLHNMNVNKFLTIFESGCQQNGFVDSNESEMLLTTDYEDFIEFYRLIEKTHQNCICCQRFFHSKLHDKRYYKDHFKCPNNIVINDSCNFSN